MAWSIHHPHSGISQFITAEQAMEQANVWIEQLRVDKQLQYDIYHQYAEEREDFECLEHWIASGWFFADFSDLQRNQVIEIVMDSLNIDKLG